MLSVSQPAGPAGYHDGRTVSEQPARAARSRSAQPARPHRRTRAARRKHQCARGGTSSALGCLGLPVTARAQDGSTPVEAAVAHGALRAAVALAQLGACVNRTEASGARSTKPSTACHTATLAFRCQSTHPCTWPRWRATRPPSSTWWLRARSSTSPTPRCCTALVSPHGCASYTAAVQTGGTALAHAAARGRHEAVALLVRLGADVRIRDHVGAPVLPARAWAPAMHSAGGIHSLCVSHARKCARGARHTPRSGGALRALRCAARWLVPAVLD